MRNLKAKLSAVAQSRRETRVKFDLLLSLFAALLGPPAERLLEFVRAVFVVITDFGTWIRFRRRGLKKYQLLFVPPSKILWGYQKAPPHHFGVVRKKYWDYEKVPAVEALGGVPGRCVLRARQEKNWAESGELDFYRKQKGYSENEPQDFDNRVEHRYRILDQIISEAKQTRRIRSRKEIDSRAFREKGGIGIIVDMDGSLSIFDGHHRFGIALGLELESIPVALCAVHPAFAKTPQWSMFYERHKTPC